MAWHRGTGRSITLSLITLTCLSAIANTSAMSLVGKSNSVAWEEAAYKAAEVALQAIRLQSGAELSLREVPLETLQVYSGRQHQIGLSIDGIQYEVVLGTDQDLNKKSKEPVHALPAGQANSEVEASVPSGLVRQHWQSQGAPDASQLLSLPDVSLSGPLELILAGGPLPVTFFTPHAVDMGPVKRVKLAAGVTVKVSGLRSIQLRRPLDLPILPMGFLAEVYAHIKLKEPGEGFDKAPGIHYLANQLRSLAINSSIPLLSLEVAPADTTLGLVVSANGDSPGMPAPRLKVKRDREGGVELTVRQGELTVSHGAADVMQQSSALARSWAWPLPHVDLSNLVPLESLLRSILAAHPFNLAKVKTHGIQMKLTKSEITGTRLMAFEMEVRSKASPQTMPENMQQAYEDLGFSDKEQLMIFDVVVSVKEKVQAKTTAGMNAASQEFVYVPVSVKLKEVHGSTLAMSEGTMRAMLYGIGNDTYPPAIGYDHQDLGVARQQAN